MICATQPVNSSFTISPRDRSQRPGEEAPIVWLSSADALSHDVGGKAASLARLVALGAPVPPAFAIPAPVYTAFARQLGLPQRAADVTADGLVAVRESILAAPLPLELAHALAGAFRVLTGTGEALAVRSSGTSEDSAAFSFAGLHDTLLDVRTFPDLELAVKTCWASLWSERAHAYRHDRGLANEPAEIAVVVQQLVRSDVSFVAFSTDPVGRANDDVVITATWGLGEAVVAGITVPDHVTVAPDGSIRDYTVGRKHLMVIPNPRGGGGAVEVPVPRALQHLPALSERQAGDIARMARELSRTLGYQADVEGGIAAGALHLFQARPITTVAS